MLQIDPYAPMYASHTTYNYAVNNPVMMNDPSGGQSYAYSNAAADRLYKIRNPDGYTAQWSEDFSAYIIQAAENKLNEQGYFSSRQLEMVLAYFLETGNLLTLSNGKMGLWESFGVDDPAALSTKNEDGAWTTTDGSGIGFRFVEDSGELGGTSLLSVYNLPVVGSAKRAGDAFDSGDYFGAIGWEAWGLAEMCAMGTLKTFGRMQATKTVASSAANSQLLIGTTRMRLLNLVENAKLRKMIEYLYREGSKFGNGSTGSMIREELKNGTVTSASGTHITKAEGALNAMRGLLKNGSLSQSDRKIVFEIIQDLTTGTGLKW